MIYLQTQHFLARPCATETTLLTIITINKNNAKGLARTIASLREMGNQVPIEFVFIDGNSSDDSLKVATRFYPEKNIHVGSDSGVYEAMNKGLHVASGQFLLWINSGDEIVASNLTSVLKDITSFKADVVCFSSFICEENTPVNRILYSAREDKLPYHWLPHPGVIYKRQALEWLGGYLCLYKITADHESLLALRRAGARFEFSNLAISCFYAGGISSSWHAEIEREKLNFDYRLVGVKTVYRRCRRWLGVPKSILYTLSIVLAAPFRRLLIEKRIKAYLRSQYI